MKIDRKRTFDAWALFCHAIRTGSVTGAAAQAGIDGAQASRRLRELEAAVGQPLLDRRHRPLAPTTVGESYFEEMAPLVDSFEAFLSRRVPAVPSLPEKTKKEILVSAFQGYAHEILPPLLNDYMAAHQDISFRIYQEKNLDDLEKGLIDVFETATEINRPTLIRYDIRRMPCILACSPRYIKKYGRPETPDDLIHHIGLERIGTNFPESKGVFYCGRAMRKAAFKQVIYSENSIALRDSAVEGLGIVCDLPIDVMRRQILNGELVQVLPGWHRQAFYRSILIAKKTARKKPYVEDFAQWLMETERLEAFKREMEIFSFLGEASKAYL